MSVARAVESPQKTLFALIDADGCVYNPIYELIILKLMYGYRDFFSRYKKFIKNETIHPDFAQKKQEYLSEFFAILQSIDFTSENVCNAEANRLVNYFVGNTPTVRLAYTNMREIENRRKILAKPPANKFELAERKKALSENMVGERKLIARKLFFVKWLDTIDPIFLDGIVCHANQPLLNFLSDAIEKNNYNHLVLIIGSNRQCWESDSLNRARNATRSFFIDISVLSQAINKRFADLGRQICTVDKATAEDVMNDQEFGCSFERNLRQLKTGGFYEHKPSIADATKSSLVYLLSQHVYHRYLAGSNQQGDVVFFDDLERLHKTLAVALPNNKAIFPKALSFTFYSYYGFELDETFSFCGEANAGDSNFKKTARLMWEECLKYALANNCEVNVAARWDLGNRKLFEIDGFRHLQFLTNTTIARSHNAWHLENKKALSIDQDEGEEVVHGFSFCSGGMM